LVPAVVAMPGVKPVEVIEPVVEIATPTIRPITSDLSGGVVRLSGTGEPSSHLQLMLNGQRTTKIDIDGRGEWLYETNLEAGDYSIQVIPPELNKQLNNKSAIAKISIPKPLVIEAPEVISVPEVVKAPIVAQVEEMKVITPVVQKVKAQIVPKPTPVVRKKIVSSKNLYKVKYGDTLNKLSRRFNVSLTDILKSNNISDKDVIEVGDMLAIPGYFSSKKGSVSGKEGSILDSELRKNTYSPEKDEWGF
jgi:LysM repeat protein